MGHLLNANREMSKEINALRQRIAQLESVHNKTIERLRVSEEKFRTIAELTYDWETWVDESGKLVWSNGAAKRIMGYTVEQLGTMNGLPVVLIAEANGETEEGRRSIEAVREACGNDEELRLRCRDGSLKWCSLSWQTVRGEEGTNLGRRWSIRDIAERKRLESERQLLLNAIESERGRLLALVDSIQDEVWFADTEKRFTLINASGLREFGLDGLTKELDVQKLASSLEVYRCDGSPRPLHEAPPLRALMGETVRRQEEMVRTPATGELRYRQVTAAPVRDGAERIVGSVSVVRDITEQVQTNEELRREQEKFLALAEHVPFGMVLIDGQGRYIYTNPKFREMFGYDLAEVSDGRTWFSKAYPDPEYRKAVISSWIDDLRDAAPGEQRPRVFTVTCKDGGEKIISFIPVQLETGLQIMTCEDITERKALEDRLAAMSVTDELTGLYNRRGFFAVAQQQLKVAERARRHVVLFFADLDHMKEINDTLGHQEGDGALADAAFVLKQTFRESDIIGRIGGDEFAVFAVDAASETQDALLVRLQTALQRQNRRAQKYVLSMSVGTAHYDPQAPSSLDQLMAIADTMMYDRKRKKEVHHCQHIR